MFALKIGKMHQHLWSWTLSRKDFKWLKCNMVSRFTGDGHSSVLAYLRQDVNAMLCQLCN